jgi:hypothetical protein
MDLNTIMQAANEAYGDDVIADYWDEETQTCRDESISDRTDYIAKGIVLEIKETYEPDKDDHQQISTAVDVIDRAAREAAAVANAIWRLRNHSLST